MYKNNDEISEKFNELLREKKNLEESLQECYETIKLLQDNKDSQFKEEYLEILFLNQYDNIIDRAYLPSWEKLPKEFLKGFKSYYSKYVENHVVMWHEIERVIILSRSYTYHGYDESYNNYNYIHQEISFQELLEIYKKLKGENHA